MQSSGSLYTPAERDPHEVLVAQQHALKAVPLLATLLDAMPEPAVVMNARRQVVAWNTRFETIVSDTSRLLGQRVGEILGCVHAAEPPGGCGTTSSCVTCWAARALDRSQAEATAASRTCRILRGDTQASGAFDLQVRTMPFDVDGALYSVLAVHDTAHEHGRAARERVFFHDVLNTAGALMGLLDICSEEPDDLDHALLTQAARLAHTLVDEIERGQRTTGDRRQTTDDR